MSIPTEEYGRTKVCLWTYFKTPPLQGGTTFFLDSRDDYLSWIWDIPISPTETSVGLVASADSIKSQRRAGRSLRTILATELSRHKRFDALLAEQPDFDVKTTSFRPYVTTRVAGPNWFMAGEAASMPDPLTGNGLTSGIRHAQWATDEIRAAGSAAEIAPRRRRHYSRHVLRLGRSFNAHIESAIYQHPMRWAFGMPNATLIYTSFAFFMNALYTRFDPRGPLGMAAFDGLFLIRGCGSRGGRCSRGSCCGSGARRRRARESRRRADGECLPEMPALMRRDQRETGPEREADPS